MPSGVFIKKKPSWNKGLPTDRQPFYGKRHTQEWRAYMSSKLKGHPYFGTKKVKRKKNINIAIRNGISLVFRPKRGYVPDYAREASRERMLKNNPVFNPLIAEKLRKSMVIKPSGHEKILMKLLNEHFPNEWKYVGDWSLWIEGKNPDFINCNGKKLIIEYNGYWRHTIEKDNAKAEIYAKYGYKTLNLYPKDLKEHDLLLQKIQGFLQ